jgi:hypothetical protein
LALITVGGNAMSDVEQRDVLIGTLGLATAALAATPAAAGDASFMNNVPDPLLSGDDLPTFKFALRNTPIATALTLGALGFARATRGY